MAIISSRQVAQAPWMTGIVALLLALCGFTLLLLAMPQQRQHRSVNGAVFCRNAWLRGGGFAALIAALFLSAMTRGWGVGTVFWIACLTASALVVIGVNMIRYHMKGASR